MGKNGYKDQNHDDTMHWEGDELAEITKSERGAAGEPNERHKTKTPGEGDGYGKHGMRSHLGHTMKHLDKEANEHVDFSHMKHKEKY